MHTYAHIFEQSDLLAAFSAFRETKPTSSVREPARAVIATNISDVWYFTLSPTSSANKDDLCRDSAAKYADYPIPGLTVVAILG